MTSFFSPTFFFSPKIAMDVEKWNIQAAFISVQFFEGQIGRENTTENEKTIYTYMTIQNCTKEKRFHKLKKPRVT